MKKMCLLWLFLGSLFLFPMGVCADEDFSPWDAWRQAYVYFQNGENARDRGDYVQALKEFREAMRCYADVQRARPDWNQKVIRTRIELCKREIASARKLLGRPSGDGDSAEIPASPAPAAPAPKSSPVVTYSSTALSGELEQLRSEAAEYKKKLFSALVELEDLRKQAVRGQAVTTELGNMMRDHRVLQEKYQFLQTRYQQLEKKSSAPNSELENSKRRLIEMRINLETAQRKLSIAEENAALNERDIQKLHREKAELQNKNTAAAGQLETQLKQLEELRRFRDEAVKEKNLRLQLEQEVKQSRENTARLADERRCELEQLNQRIKDMAGKEKSQADASHHEIRKLQLLVDKYRLETDNALRERTSLQSQYRVVQLELSELKKALQRVDDRRTQLEQDNKILRTNIEKQQTASDVTAKELRTLRSRNQQLEADLKEWADKYTRISKRFEQRENAEIASTAMLNSERRKLKEELAGMKVDMDHLSGKAKELAGTAENLRKELLREKSARMTAEQEAKQIAPLTQMRDRLMADLAALQKKHKDLEQNFAAVQRQLRENQPLLAELEQSRKRVLDSDRLRRQVAELQKNNQQLIDEKAQLPTPTVWKQVSKQAELAKSLNTQLTDIQKRYQQSQEEILNLKAQKESADLLHRRLVQQVTDMKAENLQLKAEKKQLPSMTEHLQTRKQNEVISRQLEDLQKKNQQLTEENVKFSAQYRIVNLLHQQIKELQKANQRLIAEKAQLPTHAEMVTLREKNFDLTRQVDDLRTRSSRAPAVSKTGGDKETQLLRKQLADLQKKNQELMKKRSDSSNALAEENRALNEKYNLLSGQFNDLQKSNRELAAGKAQLTAQLEVVPLLRTQLAGLQQERKKWAEEKSKLPTGEDLQKSRSEAAVLKKQLDKMQSEKSRLEQDKVQLSAQVKVTEVLRKQIAELQKNNRQLIEAAQQATARSNTAALPKLSIPAPAGGSAVSSVEELLKNARQAEKDEAKAVAIWNYRSILEAKPDHFEANLRLGTLLMQEEKFNDARMLLQKAHLQQPRDITAAVTYARALLGMKHYGNALEILEKSFLPGAPEDYSYQLTIAQAYAGAGQHQEAENHLDSAIKIAPLQSQPYVEKARLACLDGEKGRSRAAQYYEKARKLGAAPDGVLEEALGKLINERSEMVEFLCSAAAEAEMHGDVSSSVWYYSQLSEQEPDSAKFAAGLARNLLRQKKPQEALKVLDKHASAPETEMVRAFVLVSGKEYGKALAAAKNAVRLNNGKPVAMPKEAAWLNGMLKDVPGGTGAKIQALITR